MKELEKYFCPNPSCMDYQVSGKGNINIHFSNNDVALFMKCYIIVKIDVNLASAFQELRKGAY
jgi:hypothetical protein